MPLPAANKRRFPMRFADTIQNIRTIIARRAKYMRLVAEIENLSDRDLSDIRGDRSEMLFQAYVEVYGTP